MAWFSNFEFESMQDLFILQLHDLYDAEMRLVEALPRIAEGATSEELKTAINGHLEETRGRVARLEDIFKQVEIKPERQTCEAMKSILAEADQILNAHGDAAVRDAAIIAIAQRLAHFEMAGYGSARIWAEQVGIPSIATILQTTLDEAKQADIMLTSIAEEPLHAKAAS